MKQTAKALRIDHKFLSASEANAQYRSFIVHNHGQEKFEHMYETVEDQLRDAPCKFHPNESCCDSKCELEVDLMLSGSLCPPFSTQRAKRFSSGSVKDHSAYSTTFCSVVDMYQKYEPVIGIVEQVSGFMQPIESGSATTPHQLFHGRAQDCTIIF